LCLNFWYFNSDSAFGDGDAISTNSNSRDTDGALSDPEDEGIVEEGQVIDAGTLHALLEELAEELKLNESLFDGCDVTLLWTLIELASLFKDKSISKATLSRVIDIIRRILPKPNIFPETKFKFFNIIEKLCPEGNAPEVVYSCSSCSFVFDSDKIKYCSKCTVTGTPAVSVINDVESEFRHMFEYRDLHVHIDKQFAARRDALGNNISDITDGKVCQTVVNASKYDLIIIQNTDGFPFAKSGPHQLWPNFLSVVNIKPKMRSKYIALERICFTPMKPNLLKDMIDFVEKIQKLVNDGFVWRHPATGDEMRSKLIIVASTLDAQARAPVMNVNLYNGQYGCSFCEIKCTGRGKGNGPGKIYPFDENIAKRPLPLRTAAKVIQHANTLFGESRTEREARGIPHPMHVKGVKGYPPFGLIKNFDVVNSQSPDYLHSCLVGVVKRWTKHILTSTQHSRDNKYYIGQMSNILDEKLKSIRVPSFVTRPPRAVKYLSFWKASEFRNWLFFYSLPCLEGILDKKYLQHHSLLVEAIYTLNKANIPRIELEHCRKLLILYCSQFGKLYGTFEQTFNLHMLLHYVNSVENIGPLWATSTFAFENANGILRTSIHGTNNVAIELINTSKVHRALHTMKHIASIIEGGCETHKLLGIKLKLAAIFPMDPMVKENISMICTGHGIDLDCVEIHLRAKIQGITYTTKDYARATKTCSNYLAYRDVATSAVKYVRVVYYFAVENQKMFIGHEISSAGHKFKTKQSLPVRHLKKFEISDRIIYAPLNTVIYPLYNILDEVIAEPPNLHEINL
jgi:hypothetical protein